MQTIDGMALAFQRLVFRVLDGRVIPFVGAGISLQARVPGDLEFKPAVWWLRDEVKKSCDALMHDGNVKPPVTIGRAGEKVDASPSAA